MKNDRYINEAIAEINDNNAAIKSLGLHTYIPKDDHIDTAIKNLVLSVYDKCQEIASRESSSIVFDFDGDLLFESMQLAHQKDITFNELMIEIIEKQIIEENSKKED